MIASDNYNNSIVNIADATIKDIIVMLNNDHVKIPNIATVYNVSRDTVTRRLKEFGYSWDNIKKAYIYIGNDQERQTIDNMPMKEILKPKKRGTRKVNRQKLSTLNKKQATNDVAKAFDLIEEPRRHQTLFYLDDDLKQILDRVPTLYST